MFPAPNWQMVRSTGENRLESKYSLSLKKEVYETNLNRKEMAVQGFPKIQ